MLRLILAVPFLLAMGSCLADAAPTPTEMGVARELAELRARTLSDVRYDVRLSVPDERARPVTGETVVRFRWNDPRGRDLTLDFLEPAARVRSVEANGTAVPWRPVNDHVVIPAAALRADAENELRVIYAAGDEALNRAADFLYALFVPDRHHFSLPVFDQPDLKARWRLELNVPAVWVAVSNGAEERVEEAGHGADSNSARRVYRFAETKPIPSYMFAFAAGRFTIEESELDGRRMRMYHRETDAQRIARNREQLFELHRTAVTWMEQYTQIGYPFDKLDFVLIPSFQYGGMEHPGAIFYRQEGLLVDESATQTDLLGRASMIAHETAHMWFGDLVTMRWFDDVWTKEGFANLLAAKIVHTSFPDLDHGLRFCLAHHPGAYAVDRTAGANPIRQPLDNLREAGALYGPIIYDKAPVLMRQLEQWVGELTFREGVREYLRRFAYGNASWPELIEILDRRSAQDLQAWSRVWVEEAGRPTIQVEREATEGGTRFTLRQLDPAGRGRVWPQSLGVAVPEGGGIRLYSIELSEQPVVLELAGEPAWILPNGGGLEYGLFRLDPVSRAALLEGVAEIAVERVRGEAWLTLWDAVLEQEIPPVRFLERVLATLSAERDEQITGRLLATLRTVYWRLLPDVERGRRGPGVELALWNGARGAATPTRRAAYFSAWQDVVESPDGVARLRRLWSGEEAPPVRLAEPDRTRLAAALALRAAPGWMDVLDQEEGLIGNPDRRARFTFVRPALSADPSDRERFFLSLADLDNREREPWALDGLAYINHPLHAGHARAFIRPSLELLEEVQRTGDIFLPGAWVDATLSGHNRPEAAEAVAAFLAEHPDYPPRLRGKVLQAVDLVERAARMVHGWKG